MLQALGLLALAACAAPRDHFYTLSAVSARANPAPSRTRIAVTLAVHLPPALDRAEMIVHTSSDQVLVLEHERWLGLPSDQISAALGLDLEARRPELWVGAAQAALRITVDIEQLTVTSDQHALLEAHWRVREPGGTSEVLGAALLAEPLAPRGNEHAAIAAAFSRDVGALADRLIEALDARRAN